MTASHRCVVSYGTKDNNEFLMSYGHLDNRMVFGNPHHKVRVWVGATHRCPEGEARQLMDGMCD
jgi:hypothetical protein